MARYTTSIESSLSPEAAFAYMAAFENARHWDPSVVEANRVDDGVFDLVVTFGRRSLPLRYEIVEQDPPRRVVLEAQGKGFTSRDTITVEPRGTGSVVGYDAVLTFHGARRLLDPVMQRIFNGVGAKAAAGMRAALNP